MPPVGKRFIRDTRITAVEVYRCLAYRGMSEEAVLAKHPELKPEDLAGIRDAVLAEIQSIDRDEVTGRALLPKHDLVDGRYYKGRCRNATIARWNAKENCFYHWREKFGRIFIETIKYPTDEEPWWDIYSPIEELSDCKFEILSTRAPNSRGSRKIYTNSRKRCGQRCSAVRAPAMLSADLKPTGRVSLALVWRIASRLTWFAIVQKRMASLGLNLCCCRPLKRSECRP